MGDKLNIYAEGCKHYGFMPGQGPQCTLGINIRNHVGGDNYGWMARMPCCGGRMARPDNPMVPCERYSPPTEEEIEEGEREWEAAIAKMLAGECPECGGKMFGSNRNLRCPKCPDVYMRSCSHRDMEEQG